MYNCTPISFKAVQDCIFRAYPAKNKSEGKKDLSSIFVLTTGQVLIQVSKEFCFEITKAELLEADESIQTLEKAHGVSVKQLLRDVKDTAKYTVKVANKPTPIPYTQKIKNSIYKNYFSKDKTDNTELLILDDGRILIHIPGKVCYEMTETMLLEKGEFSHSIEEACGITAEQLLHEAKAAHSDKGLQIVLTPKYSKDSNGNFYARYFEDPKEEPNLDEYIDNEDLEGYVEAFNKKPVDNSEDTFDKFQMMNLESKDIWKKIEDNKLHAFLINAGIMD